ncbi:unnamed protein product, partial [Prorocentrum cordatum]
MSAETLSDDSQPPTQLDQTVAAVGDGAAVEKDGDVLMGCQDDSKFGHELLDTMLPDRQPQFGEAGYSGPLGAKDGDVGIGGSDPCQARPERDADGVEENVDGAEDSDDVPLMMPSNKGVAARVTEPETHRGDEDGAGGAASQGPEEETLPYNVPQTPISQKQQALLDLADICKNINAMATTQDDTKVGDKLKELFTSKALKTVFGEREESEKSAFEVDGMSDKDKAKAAMWKKVK